MHTQSRNSHISLQDRKLLWLLRIIDAQVQRSSLPQNNNRLTNTASVLSRRRPGRTSFARGRSSCSGRVLLPLRGDRRSCAILEEKESIVGALTSRSALTTPGTD